MIDEKQWHKEFIRYNTMTPTTQPLSPTNNTLKQALEEYHKTSPQGSLNQQESPHILIVGPSGSGKSRSIKNLNESQTIIFNPENKALPFADAARFKDHKLSGFNRVADVDKWLKIAKTDPEIKYIIFDSFTEYLEMLMRESRELNKGYDIFTYYNAKISAFLNELRTIKTKIVILTAIDELTKVELPSGATNNRRFLSTEGKVWLGKIESKFSIVLFTESSIEPGSKPPKANYKFCTQSDGVTSAKSPEGMFPYAIDNDLNLVVKQVEKYFGLV